MTGRRAWRTRRAFPRRLWACLGAPPAMSQRMAVPGGEAAAYGARMVAAQRPRVSVTGRGRGRPRVCRSAGATPAPSLPPQPAGQRDRCARAGSAPATPARAAGGGGDLGSGLAPAAGPRALSAAASVCAVCVRVGGCALPARCGAGSARAPAAAAGLTHGLCSPPSAVRSGGGLRPAAPRPPTPRAPAGTCEPEPGTRRGDPELEGQRPQALTPNATPEGPRGLSSARPCATAWGMEGGGRTRPRGRRTRGAHGPGPGYLPERTTTLKGPFPPRRSPPVKAPSKTDREREQAAETTTKRRRGMGQRAGRAWRWGRRSRLVNHRPLR